jgi:endonuclease/exonuclease/phosphatase family metal-dependent hydrolase
MSAVLREIVTRDRHGVVLRYLPDRLGPHHTEQRPQVSDRRRLALIKAEREWLTLRIVADHLDISDIGRTRIDDALEAIRVALEFKRQDYGMVTRAEAAA